MNHEKRTALDVPKHQMRECKFETQPEQETVLTSTRPPLSAAELVKHPEFEHVTWPLKPAKKGKVAIANGRGGPVQIAYEIHGNGPTKLVVSTIISRRLPNRFDSVPCSFLSSKFYFLGVYSDKFVSSFINMVLSGLWGWQALRHHGNGKPKTLAMVRTQIEIRARSIRV